METQKIINLSEVKKAKEELNKIKKSQDEFNENSNKVLREIENKFYKLESELRDKKNNELDKQEKTTDEINNKFEANKENSIQIIQEFKQMIDFYKIYMESKNYGLKSPLVYNYDYLKNKNGYSVGDKQKIYYNPVDCLVDDDFKKLLIYVTKNRKPKNCFSLIVCGNSRFDKENLWKERRGSLPYSYGIDAQIDNSNIRVEIKNFPSEKQAIEYLNRNKSKILKKFLEEHSELELRYCEFIKALEDEEVKKSWEIAYLEEMKYYYENGYFHGTETEEYKQIIKRLENLK